MLKNQFIQFKSEIPSDSCELAIPVVLGGDGVSFFVDDSFFDQFCIFAICDRAGHMISGLLNYKTVSKGYAGRFFGDDAPDMTFNKNLMLAKLNGETCVRIQLGRAETSSFNQSYVFDGNYLIDHEVTPHHTQWFECEIKIPVGESYYGSEVDLEVAFLANHDSGYCPYVRDENGDTTDTSSQGAYGKTEGILRGTVDEDGYVSLSVIFPQCRESSDVLDNYGTLTFSPPEMDVPNVNVTLPTTYTHYSNLLHIVDNADGDYALLKYKCDEDAFDFPFHTAGDVFIRTYLPILLQNPQNVQDDKTYAKANGEVVTLYAKYYKEWEGETEYIPEDWHDKIVAALSCDEVYIDGKRVTKSDNYSVDWANKTTACDGKTKIARATFKVRENVTQRNSNY